MKRPRLAVRAVIAMLLMCTAFAASSCETVSGVGSASGRHALGRVGVVGPADLRGRAVGSVGLCHFSLEASVRNTLLLVAGVCVFSVSAMAWTAAQQARTVSTALTPIDEVLQAVRADLQGERADILAKNLTLTSEQAAKFWPLYEAYQKEQNVIMDEQLRGIQRFIESFDTLDDATALGLINAHFDRDARMNALRQKWLGEFQKTLNTKLAVRVMQIDRRLSPAHQIMFTSKIPLAH
jgi:Spy/CpxP family protein refolding chaperone